MSELRFSRQWLWRMPSSHTYLTNKIQPRQLSSRLALCKFLGIHITDALSWKKHIHQLIPKLSSACYPIRAVKPYVNLESLLMVYYAYFHSLMCYGIMLWVNSSYAINVFRAQKRSSESCWVSEVETPTGSLLLSWAFSYCYPSIFSLYCLIW
jgi:hypothetical protein